MVSESEAKPAKEARTVRLPRTPAEWLLVLLLVATGIGALYWAIGPDSPTARNEFTRTVVQILGGGALLTSLYFTARSLEINRQTLEVNRRTLQHNFDTQQENQKINRETLQLNLKSQEENQQANRDRDVTARFTSAVEQLGSEKIAIRLGAIYALERLSKDSATDYSTIMELLTAYVRERSPWEPPPWEQPAEPEDEVEMHRNSPIGIDIQAVLTVIQRRDKWFGQGEDTGLDLSGTQLMGANLMAAHLEGSQFVEAHLRGASFGAAHLEGASFEGAHLEEAGFESADLRRAYFTEAYLERASFVAADLRQAYLGGAHLQGTFFNLAHLEGADLTGTLGLTRQQLLQAHLSPETKLPPGIEIDLT